MVRFMVSTAVVVGLAMVQPAQAGGIKIGGVPKVGGFQGVPKVGGFQGVPKVGGFQGVPKVGGFQGVPKVGVGFPHQVAKQPYVQCAPVVKPYCAPSCNQPYAIKCHYGYCYKGASPCVWSHQCYSPTYGCTVYYDPYTCQYYYWCAQDYCYYPVSYCPYGCYK